MWNIVKINRPMRVYFDSRKLIAGSLLNSGYFKKTKNCLVQGHKIQEYKCFNWFYWDRKPKSRTLLALYCTKSWWEQVVTDNQGLTEKWHKHNHVIIKGKELISHQLSNQWTENNALWSALWSQLTIAEFLRAISSQVSDWMQPEFSTKHCTLY